VYGEFGLATLFLWRCYIAWARCERHRETSHSCWEHTSLFPSSRTTLTFLQKSLEMTALNPIMPGFNPDPSICRVGSDYFLATSTFEFFPGVPIYHSTDLINWKLICHALSRPSQLNMRAVPMSCGVWAPTLRYNKGRWYMTTTCMQQISSDDVSYLPFVRGMLRQVRRATTRRGTAIGAMLRL
jgi:hypothetical protein